MEKVDEGSLVHLLPLFELGFLQLFLHVANDSYALHQNHQVKMLSKGCYWEYLNPIRLGLFRVREGLGWEHLCPQPISLDRDMLEAGNLVQW